jgi:hypothetical protein
MLDSTNNMQDKIIKKADFEILTNKYFLLLNNSQIIKILTEINDPLLIYKNNGRNIDEIRTKNTKSLNLYSLN